MTYRPSTATGRVPAYLAEPSPEKQLDAVVESLTDSIAGLRRAVELAEDDAVSGAFVEMAEQREEVRSAILLAALEARMQVSGDVSGTTAGTLRRGWMHLESALTGDGPILELIRTEDSRLAKDLQSILRQDLATSVAGALREAAHVVEDGKRHLDRLTE